MSSQMSLYLGPPLFSPLRVISVSLSLHDISTPLSLRSPAKQKPRRGNLQAGEIYEKLWFSGRLEDEKKVLTLILLHSENATAEGDATIDTSTKADATSVYRGAHGDSDTRSPWLREVDVVVCRPVRTSRDVRSGRSSRPQHRRVLYFPHHRLWIMECSCKEGEMEQYLEEKKASQKRPATTFQRQDKKKAVY
ncbi:hypothetical protein Taro_016722 [Colocasia esculenta]|uniref:Uncharacterized protein n=1 Tax=Colocasia esculenta TaxID=4460 RepID=A0A843UEH4_COLES|nr:hypothetical protein [Colocasia esculenta]